MIEKLGNLFGRNKSPKTLDDIPLQELRAERVRLEQQERKLVKEISEIEAQKNALFEQGKQAKGSQHVQRSIAQKIISVDRKVKMTDRKLRTISKQLQAVNNFIHVKESKRELQNSGLFDTINKMDIEELDSWIEKASIDGDLNVQTLDDMLRRMNSSMDNSSVIEEDSEIANIMAMFQDESASSSELGDILTEDDSDLEEFNF